MPMNTALRVRLHGVMPPGTLLRIREKLSLQPRGRLSDAEDANFGYRWLQHDDQNWIHLDLYREDDANWAIALTYLGQAPEPQVIDQVLSQVLDAAGQNGLSVGKVAR